MNFDLSRSDREIQVRRLASCGLSLFPVGADKIPKGGWKALQSRPNTEKELSACIQSSDNLGYCTGSHAGIVGVDLDDQAAIEWADKNLPPTPNRVVTGKGEHRLYKHPGGKVANSTNESLPGLTGKIDIRGDGGYLVAPGSRHESGHIYRAVGDWTAEGFANLPDYPAHILKKVELVAAPTPAKPKAKSKSRSGRPDALQRATDYVAAVPGQPEGGRDNAAFELAGALLGGFGLSRPVAMPLMQEWDARNTPPLGYTCLCKKLDQAEKNAGANPEYPIGYLLDEDRPFTASQAPDSVDAGDTAAPDSVEASEEPTKRRSLPWPKPIAREAYRGILGRTVDTLEPHTESDPAALLLQGITVAGHQIGDGPYFQVEGQRHGTNTFLVIVGTTSKGRKGTSLGRTVSVARATSTEVRNINGLGSGEALIAEVGDREEDANCLAEALERKRVLVMEGEFAQLLKVSNREGNTISPVLRNAWDREPISNLTKGNRLRSHGHHVSVIGHITAAELRELLSDVEVANGLANRFLVGVVKRSKTLPEGGNLKSEQIAELGRDLEQCLLRVRQNGKCPVIRSPLARELWAHIYPSLSEGYPGLAGAVLARGEAYVTRLSLLYAVLEGCTVVRPEHLLAALAVWDYCTASVFYLFGNRLGHSVADTILDELRERPEGLTKTEMSALFGRNKSASEIGRALRTLEEQNLAKCVKERGQDPNQKRPTERFVSLQENNFVNFVSSGFLGVAKKFLASRGWVAPYEATKNEFNEFNLEDAPLDPPYEATKNEFNEFNPDQDQAPPPNRPLRTPKQESPATVLAHVGPSAVPMEQLFRQPGAAAEVARRVATEPTASQIHLADNEEAI